MKKIVEGTAREYGSELKDWVKSKDEKNDLDRFLTLVFELPDQKREWCEKNLGDPHINYIEGKHYKIEIDE